MIRGRDFLEILRLLSSAGSEVSVRTQIGRAYYAAFLEARTWCEQRVGMERSRGAQEHAQVRRILAPLDSTISDQLEFLRRARNLADYDIEVSLETIVEQLPIAAAMAQSIIDRLDALDSPNSEHESDTR